jgi:hypothetical protein
MVADRFVQQIRREIQGSLHGDRMVASTAFNEAIVPPPEPEPMEIWQDFISRPTEQHVQEIQQVGPEAFSKKIEDMLALGESIIGPSARSLMPYFDHLLAPDIAQVTPEGYPSLLEQALLEVEGYAAAPGTDETLQPG